uniref:Endo/exonuclease/phosphatase domain-containing protein n=1 Tax=Angiostrongylus cantonensis TaxID=6313 RepID=A0A0K0D222_ANGCA
MIRYDVIGLAETTRRHPFNAVYDTGEELLLATCDSRGASASNYDEEEVEAFYMNFYMEKFYRKDHTFFKVIIGDFNAKIGPRRSSEARHIGTHGLEWNEQDAVADNINEEYDWLIEHIHVSAMKAESSKITKRRLSPETLELVLVEHHIFLLGS